MISQEQRYLLDVLASELFHAPKEQILNIDMPAVMREAEQQSVFPLAFHSLEQELQRVLSPEQFQDLYARNLQYLATGFQNFYLHGELHSLMTEAQLPYTVIKGLESASYYPEPLLRTMGDVDFLVSLSDREKAEELILAEGYQKARHAEAHGFHWSYHRGRDTMELHWDIPGLPAGGGEKLKTLLADAISTGQLIRVCDTEIFGVDVLHHGLILLLHTASHLTAGGAGLRHLCDWLVFENSLSEQTFTALFEKPLKETGLWTFAAALTQTGVVFLGCEERRWCGHIDTELTETLLADFLEGGNFGRKQPSRQAQTKIFRNNCSRKIEDGTLLQSVLKNVDLRTEHDYPICCRHKVLKPIFWIWTALGYYLRVLCGKRVNIFQRNVFAGAKQRMNLYGKLRLFIPEDELEKKRL